MTSQFILLQAQAADGGFSGIFMIIALIAVFYFFMIRPQQKRQKEINKFRESLAKGNKVVTAGGIYGTIHNINEKTIVLEVAKGVNITVDKGSVYPSAEEATQDNQQQEK